MEQEKPKRQRKAKQAAIVVESTDATPTVFPPIGIPANLPPATLLNWRKRAERQTPLKVAIVGSAPASYSLAPFKDESWELWSLNGLWHTEKRWTRWFDIHPISVVQSADGGKHWKWMTEQTSARPIYLQEVVPEIPGSAKYPIEEALDLFGSYFNNQISYMLALAIMEGASQIGLWGVDMACAGPGDKSEYAAQRPSCEHLIGIAKGMGIDVFVPPQSDLLKTRKLYGYGMADEFFVKNRARQAELRQRKAKFEQEAADKRAQAEGLMQAAHQAEVNAGVMHGQLEECAFQVQQWA